MQATNDGKGPRAALVVAHPGHELAILGWLQAAAPTVFVLTDGGGREGRSRIGSTRDILALAGGTPGAIFGRFAESQVYGALLGGATAPFVKLAEELAGELVRGGFDTVAADAAEGFQPTHDVFRLVVDAAVERARRGGSALRSYEFVLFGRQDRSADAAAAAIRLALDDDGLARKLDLASRYQELTAEFRAAMTGDMAPVLAAFPDLAAIARERIGELGPEAYRVECLRPVPPARWRGIDVAAERPFFELYGEALARAGRVPQVIRLGHLEAVARALRAWLDAA